MRHIKYLLMAICLTWTIGATAQAVRNNFGTLSGYASTSMHCMTAQGVNKSFGKDTLVNGDTGYAYVWVGQGFNIAVDMLTTTLTGTVATTSNIVYGVNNNGVPLTAAQVLTAQKYALTGNTTYCAGCVGASSTTVPGSALHYVWQFPYNSGVLFDNIIIRTIQTGTCTATYSPKLITEY